jgi:hypothetical protein
VDARRSLASVIALVLLGITPAHAGNKLVVRRLLQKDRTPVITPAGHLFQPNHYVEVRTATKMLLDQYPPDRHVYVGIGRALSPVIAMLQNLDPNLAFNFPASGLSATSGYDPAPHKAEFFRHFAQLLPASVLNGNKDIVLIDRSVRTSGTTIARVRSLLQEYLRSIGSSVNVVGAGFSEQQPGHGLGWVNTGSLPFMRQINNAGGGDGERYENAFGEYGKHYIGLRHRVEDLKRQPGFDNLKSLIHMHMANDEDLDAYLGQSQAIERHD